MFIDCFGILRIMLLTLNYLRRCTLKTADGRSTGKATYTLPNTFQLLMKGGVMTVLSTINERRHKYGMPIAELARRTDIDYQALRSSLNGERRLSASELLRVCSELGLSLEDFKHADLTEGVGE